MNWRHNGSEQLDDNYTENELTYDEELALQEEADEERRDEQGEIE